MTRSSTRTFTQGLVAVAASALVLGGGAVASGQSSLGFGSSGGGGTASGSGAPGGSLSGGSLGGGSGSTGTAPVSPYVALGDSYSAGAGIAPLVADAPARCSRSTLNFAHDIDAALHPASFTDVTCGGARTADITGSQAPGVPPQLDAVTPDTRLVTLTIGGNDGDVFGNMVGGCAQAAQSTGDYVGTPCRTRFGDLFSTYVTTSTGPAVTGALQAIRAKAPAARVVILGYPRILPETPDPTCIPSMPFALGDVAYMNGVEKTLNAEIAKAATAAGATYVDMWAPSTGHDACSGADRWVEPLVNPVNAAPVHPNATGEKAMAAEVLKALPSIPSPVRSGALAAVGS